jgi:hypothetical protein
MKFGTADKSILHSLNTPIYVGDPAKDILYLNPAPQRGYS